MKSAALWDRVESFDSFLVFLEEAFAEVAKGVASREHAANVFTAVAWLTRLRAEVAGEEQLPGATAIERLGHRIASQPRRMPAAK